MGGELKTSDGPLAFRTRLPICGKTAEDHIYAVNDTIWMIAAMEPELTEALETLP